MKLRRRLQKIFLSLIPEPGEIDLEKLGLNERVNKKLQYRISKS